MYCFWFYSLEGISKFFCQNKCCAINSASKRSVLLTTLFVEIFSVKRMENKTNFFFLIFWYAKTSYKNVVIVLRHALDNVSKSYESNFLCYFVWKSKSFGYNIQWNNSLNRNNIHRNKMSSTRPIEKCFKKIMKPPFLKLYIIIQWMVAKSSMVNIKQYKCFNKISNFNIIFFL